MSSIAIDENVLKQTSETLGKVIKQVPLTDKLLSRPPFKFLHDIIKEIIRNNGFLNGLYTDDELISENIKNKDAKIAFLQKTIDALAFITSKPLDQIKASKIVAGLEPEHTNELLQILGKCVISRKESSLAVRRVLKGEKPGATNLNLSVSEDLLQAEKVSVRKNSIASKADDQATKSTTPKPPAKQSSKTSTSTTSQSKTTTANKLNTKATTSKLNTTTKPKSPVKSTATNATVSSAKKPTSTGSKSNLATTTAATKSSNQQTKVASNRSTLQNRTTGQQPQSQQAIKRGQERIAKPVTKPPSSNKATTVSKQTNLVNQTNDKTTRAKEENSIANNRNRTLTKEELNAIETAKQANRAAEDEENAANLLENEQKNSADWRDEERNESNNEEMTNGKATKVNSSGKENESSVSLEEETNQNVAPALSESTAADQNSNRTKANENLEMEKNELDGEQSEDENTDMSRSVVALYSVSFFFLFLSFFTGIAGCWKRSHANLVATGILQLLASLMDGGSMGLWHAVQYYDTNKLKDELSYEAWPAVHTRSQLTQTIDLFRTMCVGMCFL